MQNIGRFKKGRGKYREIFLELVDKINDCCNLLISSKINLENNENRIRNRLLKDYLNNNTVRDRLKIKGFIFTAESAEINGNYRQSGYTDIRVSLPLTFNETEAYYILECKRIDGNSQLNKLYVLEGIMRFVTGNYPNYFGFNGMIGFIVKALDIEKNIGRLNELCTRDFPQSGITQKIEMDRPPNGYKSLHENSTTHKQVTLYHLMIDFSSIIMR